MKNAIKEKLNDLCKDELCTLARKYKIKNFSSLKKAELVKELLEKAPEEELRKDIFPGSDRKVKTLYRIAAFASIIGVLITILTLIPSGEKERQMDLVKFERKKLQ